MRMLKCEIFPLALVLEDDEKTFYKLTEKAKEAGAFPTAGAATTISYSGDGIGVIVLVALGDTSEDLEGETESILTHEAVHVKQFLFESIGEDHPGVETEAYLVQYLANYLIKEWHYRQIKKQKEK